ncbi:probable E3 ubiquitin-protein ligase ARI8 isoform X1 [Telopea speciosissima]|uniref:probable E3 ubiquitin-protein ligase ARI8 isoform X1 n=2 Tax=Telopea speciosissima TaxID=54955 RepID=UPI001CC40632|nr:probable E3 ubiquitin-protein ligase ARI8 isoform X1 [Telopea speciosissima]
MDSDDYVYEDGNYRDMDSEDDVFGDGDSLDYNVKKLQPQQQQNYTILSEEDIRRHQEEDITTISMVLSISKAWSSILMRHYNWSTSKVHEAWFADEEKVRKAVGLLEQPIVEIPEKGKEITCGICFEINSLNKMAAAICGHLFCVSCWAGYISTSINDGPGCLMLRCPDPSCSVAIDQDFIDRFASNEEKEKFSSYFLRSYIETNRKTKWCPAPGCEYAVEFEVCSTGSSDVTCNCSYHFCWTCGEEVHRPLDCDTVTKWMLKNSSEAENMNWLLANSKQCPKCKRQIQKSQGCVHMTCAPPCGYEFCWLCLGPWSEHEYIEGTGDYFSCNSYAIAKLKGTYDEAEMRRKMAKNSLDKYTHYYERWVSNQSSGKKALEDLNQIQTEKKLKELSLKGLSKMDLEFITEAWFLIIECRRVLKWTYAYGYYIPEHEEGKREFFEYLQGQAESGLERLHYCAETELQVYIEAN